MLTSFVIGNTCIRESPPKTTMQGQTPINLNIYARQYMHGDYVVASRIDLPFIHSFLRCVGCLLLPMCRQLDLAEMQSTQHC